VTPDPLLCYPDPPPPGILLALRQAGYTYRGTTGPAHADEIEQDVTENGWGGAVVSAVEDLQGALAFCRHVRRKDVPITPLLLIVADGQLPDLQLRDDIFDDFCLHPPGTAELIARLQHLFWRAGGSAAPEMIEYGPLQLNLETYQAAVTGKVLDLTYMEYELLRFLAAHPGKVFTRETLLSRVWGYEYYGGARTVDVHIRRLRAKLGEEHANLIQTVRSVGYRLGQVGWLPMAAARVGET
jgi:DNA-binding response OmpR family regulator